jgi:hypothetical protein
VTGNAKVCDFPGAGQVPTVGQRLCPFMSKVVPAQRSAIGPVEAGMLTVNCAGATCRLWGWCSGEMVEKIIAVLVK